MLIRPSVLVLATLAACQPQPIPDAPETAKKTAEQQQVGDDEPDPAGKPPLTAELVRGVPHSSVIDRAKLSHDGTAALTRDSLGGIRLWQKLDGSTQPLMVPLRGAQHMSLAATSNGFTLALIDSANALHILGFDRGGFDELFAAPPHKPVLAVEVLPGGNHVVTLSQDRTIRLLTASGKQLDIIQKRRFRPNHLRVSADGKIVVAAEVEFGSDKHDITLHRITVDTKTGKLVMGDDSYSHSAAAAISESQADLSPDGRRFAFLVNDPKTRKWSATVIDLVGRELDNIEIAAQFHEQPVLGFISNTELVVTATQSGNSWRISVSDKATSYPIPGPATHFGVVAVHAFAKGHRIAGLGTWLFVQDLVNKKQRYLGFEQFFPSHAAVSPEGKWVAWVVSTGRIYIEPIGDDQALATQLSENTRTPPFRAAFIDEDHLITADSVGGIRLLDWQKNKVLASTDGGGPFNDFEYDKRNKLLRVARSAGQTWIYEVSLDNGFVGPYIVGDGSFRSGFLDERKGVLWTFDNQNKLRTYTLAELRKGISSESTKDRAVDTKITGVLSIDRKGAYYNLSSDRRTLFVRTGNEKEDVISKARFPPSQVQRVIPSPDVTRYAVWRNNGVLSVHDRATGKHQWSFSFVNHIAAVQWSADGKFIAAGGQLGAVVFNASTGDVLRKSCGPWFEARETPPANTFAALAQPNICEQ